MEKISVIVPVYNGASTIKRCLSSIIDQSVPIYEILVVNDGSTDETQTILDELANKHNNLKIISIPNSGVSNARNIALNTASGDYIGFVDSDDYIESDMYEILLSDIINSKSDCSVCGYFTEKEGLTTPVTIGADKVVSSQKFLHDLFIEESVGGFMWNRLFKKNIFTGNDIFDLAYSVCEDKLLQLKLFMNASHTVSIINKPLYHYVQNASSATSVSGLIKNNKFVYTEVFEAMKTLIKSGISPDKAALISSLMANYRSILEYSMYSLLSAGDINRQSIHDLQTEMKRVKSEIYANVLLSPSERRHYIILAYIPLIYKALRL